MFVTLLTIASLASAIPNPSAVFCVNCGYRYEVRTRPSGDQYGVCVFPNGSECGAWAYYYKCNAPQHCGGDCNPSAVSSGPNCCPWPCPKQIIYVDDDGPADFNNIQAAINDSNDGDTVVVADGIYTGLGNRDIDFQGKAITVRSENGPENCIIDCQATGQDNHRGFYFHRAEGPDSVVDGFTITNGYFWYSGDDWTDNCGGGIQCCHASPTITRNIIRGNSVGYAGNGICCDASSAIITNNVIAGNGHYAWGSGIACLNNSSPKIQNNIIEGNWASNVGGVYCKDSHMTLIGNTIKGNYGDCGIGGIGCLNSSATIMNNLIVGNDSGDDFGGGIWSMDSVLDIINCTIAGNFRDGIRASGSVSVSNCIIRGPYPISGGLTVTYSNVEEGYEGVGNIDADPCFADGDYHLKSQAGRWDANEGRWTKDEVTSPCIDAGDPKSPIGLEPFPNGGRINMGAYGGTAEASKSYFGEPVCETIVAGDINGDCIVNLKDFAIMAFHWLEEHQ